MLVKIFELKKYSNSNNEYLNEPTGIEVVESAVCVNIQLVRCENGSTTGYDEKTKKTSCQKRKV